MADQRNAREQALKALASGIDPRADGWAILALADEVAALRVAIEAQALAPAVEVAGAQAPAEVVEQVAGTPVKTRRRSS